MSVGNTPIDIFTSAMSAKGIEVKRKGDFRYLAKCPAHDDTRPSLSIKVFPDGGIAPKCCSQGCTRKQILTGVGLTERDIHPGGGLNHTPITGTPAKGKSFPTIESAVSAMAASVAKQNGLAVDQVEEAGQWEYRREGILAGIEVRFNLPTQPGEKTAKEFRPLSAADGGFVPYAPAQWPLYNEEELAGAALVTFHEGGKAADAAAQCGFIATTTAGGAKNPDKTSFSRLATVKTVAIFPDNDEPGEGYVTRIAGKVRAENPHAIVKVVRIPGLPPKGDFFDFSAEMRDCQSAEEIYAEVMAMIEAAPEVPVEVIEGAIEIVSATKLIHDVPELRPIIIDGLQRRGEVANVIAAPKTGKTWAIQALGMAIASGGKWFGRQCMQGRVLLIDNELHKNTLAKRLSMVAAYYGISNELLEQNFSVVALRGKLRDMRQLGEFFRTITPDTYSAIIIDSLYRAMPAGMDENSNVDITALYNLIDQYAAIVNSAFILVHHTSKGIQGGKSITDVGAGAGAQSRAADTHITLRPHEEDDVIVIDAVVRSFPPPSPSCWKVAVPAFLPMPDLDPLQLRTERKRKKQVDEDEPEVWTPLRFAEQFVEAGGAGQIIEQVHIAASGFGVSKRMANGLIRQAVEAGFVQKTGGTPGVPSRYSRNALVNK